MKFEPFFTRCPEMAENETRSFEPGPGSSLPPDRYCLLETFCSDARCDCRRVVFLVARLSDDEIIATLNYGWESLDFYRRWSPQDPQAADLKGVLVDPLGKQSPWSDELKAALEWMIASDKEFRDRIVRHYMAFKGGAP